MPTTKCFSIFASLLLSWLTIASSTTACAADGQVEPATYQAPEPNPNMAPGVSFSQQPAQVGDRVQQQLAVQVDIATTIMQAGQIASQDSSSMQRQQHRLVEVVEVADGRVCEARVSFSHSRQQMPENQDADQLQVQPVEGKSYFVKRRGKQLIVTDQDRAIPPQDEFEIVVLSVQTLGLPNPLAKFLLGRTIPVGDRLQLPRQIAESVMGFGSQLGQVEKFELELKELRSIDGQPCAVFAATIEIKGHPDNPISIDVEGQVVIQTATCRTVGANLSGPLHMASAENGLHYQAEGGLQVAIRSRYGNAKK